MRMYKDMYSIIEIYRDVHARGVMRPPLMVSKGKGGGGGGGGGDSLFVTDTSLPPTSFRYIEIVYTH